MGKKRGLSFLVGAGIGAGLAALFTTDKGKEYQKKIAEICSDIIDKVKNLDANEVKSNIEAKVEEIKLELAELDKEKVLDVAKTKAKKVQDKATDLANYAVEKGTPVVQDATEKLRQEAVKVTKQVLKKLEAKEKKN